MLCPHMAEAAEGQKGTLCEASFIIYLFIL
jgi:hypothetical protein